MSNFPKALKDDLATKGVDVGASGPFSDEELEKVRESIGDLLQDSKEDAREILLSMKRKIWHAKLRIIIGSDPNDEQLRKVFDIAMDALNFGLNIESEIEKERNLCLLENRKFGSLF